jgi:hypothetical protein
MVIIINMTNTIEYNEYKTGNRNEAIVFSLRPFVAKMSSALQGLIMTLVLIISGVYVMSQNVGALEEEANLFGEMTQEERADYVTSLQSGPAAISEDAYLSLDLTDQVDYIESLKTTLPTFENRNLDNTEMVILYEAIQDPANSVFTFDNDPNNDIADGWSMAINAAADTVFRDKATIKMRVFLRIFITVLPSLLIFGAYYILNKKYIIDEVYYDEITKATAKRLHSELKS